MKTYALELDKTRELRFGFKASRDIRNKFGERSIESMLEIKWDEIPVLVWAGLRWEDKSLTLPQVEDLLDDSIPEKNTIMGVTDITLSAYAAHLGIELKKGKAGDKEKEKSETEKPGKQKATETIPSTRKQKKPPVK